MKMRQLLAIATVMVLGATNIYAADPFTTLVENLNEYVFYIIGPSVIFLGWGIGWLYKPFNPERADKIIKGSIFAGVCIMFGEKIWDWIASLGSKVGR